MYGQNNFTEGYMVGRDSNGSGNNNGGWGCDGAWWIVILLIFGWGGFGNNGWGNRGGNSGGGAADGYTLATDFANLERKLDGVNNGLCDGFYAQNTGMLNGFAGVQNTMSQGFAGVNASLTTQGYETRNAINGIGTQIADCCCKTQSGMKDISYNTAMQMNAVQKQISDCCCDVERQIERGFCDTGYNMSNNTRDIIQSSHADTDRLMAKLDAMENARMQEKISALQTENQTLKFAASQANQNAYLINELKPCPKPAYITCNPYQSIWNPQNDCRQCC